jgi:CBS domain-containing protein
VKVQDLCICDVAAVSAETTLSRAGALMRKYNIGSMPVVDRKDRVIGMITDRDVALEVTRRNAPASELFVDEIMTESVASCLPQDHLLDALELMRKNRVRRLPVTDENDVLVGILSIDDIICHAVEEGSGGTLSYEDILETLDAIAQDYCVESSPRTRATGRSTREPQEGRRRTRSAREESR